MTEEAALTPDSARLPPGAGPARLVACERTGRWAVALRRELPPGVRVWEARSLAEGRAVLAEGPAGFAVVELAPAGVDPLVEWLVRLDREFPLARAAVVADRSLAPCEWLVREAGAVHFTTSPRLVRPLAEVALRHLAEAPQPPRSLVEEIWAGLPWGEGRGSEEGGMMNAE
jgi:hypothetical protein